MEWEDDEELNTGLHQARTQELSERLAELADTEPAPPPDSDSWKI